MLLHHSLLYLQLLLTLSYSAPALRTSTRHLIPGEESHLNPGLTVTSRDQDTLQENQPLSLSFETSSLSKKVDISHRHHSESSNDQILPRVSVSSKEELPETNGDQLSSRRLRRATRRATGKQRRSLDRINGRAMGGFFYHPGSKGKKKGSKKG
ncbi:hypothetical protein ACHWQZ_G000907 [Mnemiopsis leidyi]